MTAPTPEALAHVFNCCCTYLIETDGSKHEVLEPRCADLQLATALALTKQDAQIANRNVEIDRLRAFVAQLREDSLHTELVAKMAAQAREIEEAVTILELFLEETRGVGDGEPIDRRIPTQLRVGDIREARTFCARHDAEGG